MARRNELRELMQTPLPSITEQRRKTYRPTLEYVEYIYDLINKEIFNNQLTRPPIEMGICRGYWGVVLKQGFETRPGTDVVIRVMDKWFCIQWMITTVAHEMCHQYENDILKKNMTHRQSFFIWRDTLAKYGIDLKTAHGMRRWFKHQNFAKC